MNPYLIVLTFVLLASTSSLNAMDDMERSIKQRQQEKLSTTHRLSSTLKSFAGLSKINKKGSIHNREAHDVAGNEALMDKASATIQQAKEERDQELARRAEKGFEIEVLLLLKLHDVDDISVILNEQDTQIREKNKSLYHSSSRTNDGQKQKLREKLPQFIDALRKELKLSHADMDEYLKKWGKKPSKELNGEFDKIISGSGVLKKQQEKHRKLTFCEKEIKAPKVSYDNRKYVCLSHNKFHKKFSAQLMTCLDPNKKININEFYEILQINEKSAAYKAPRNQDRISRTYYELKELLEKPSGFVIIPSGEENPFDHVLVKAQLGVDRRTSYRFYMNQLQRKFAEEGAYNVYKNNHTFIALKTGEVLALPHENPQGMILSLSTKGSLSTLELIELNTIANQIWEQKHIPLVPTNEKQILQEVESPAIPTIEIEEKTTTNINVNSFEEERVEESTAIADSELPVKLILRSTGTPQTMEEENGKITIVTDHNANASYQLESDHFSVAEDGIIKIPYKITVQPDGKMSLGLLNTARNGWYGNELVLEAGTHEGIYKRRVPAGESTASLVFRNYHLGTAGQTTFTIEEIDLQQEESLRLNSTGVPIYFAKEPDGKITIVTDNNASACYQLMGERFFVQEGGVIKIPYNITVQPGGKMSLGLLNAAENGWYGDELVLEAGTHEDIYERRIPSGETATRLVFRNYHLGTPGETTFTINALDIQLEEVTEPILTMPQTVPEETVASKLKATIHVQAIERDENGKIKKVTTDNNASASYQLESDRFAVESGETIRVPYNITVEEGGIMALGLLNAARNGWYNELVLKAGVHEGIFEGIVPEGESDASLILRNYHLGTAGQTTFTINALDIQQ